MAVRNYTAEFRIEDSSDDTSVVVRSAQFETTSDGEATAETVRAFIKAGLDNIQSPYASKHNAVP